MQSKGSVFKQSLQQCSKDLNRFFFEPIQEFRGTWFVTSLQSQVSYWGIKKPSLQMNCSTLRHSSAGSIFLLSSTAYLSSASLGSFRFWDSLYLFILKFLEVFCLQCTLFILFWVQQKFIPYQSAFYTTSSQNLLLSRLLISKELLPFPIKTLYFLMLVVSSDNCKFIYTLLEQFILNKKSRKDLSFFMYRPSESKLMLKAINFWELTLLMLTLRRQELEVEALGCCCKLPDEINADCRLVNGNQEIGRLKHCTPSILWVWNFKIRLFTLTPVTSGFVFQSGYFFLLLFYYSRFLGNYVDLIMRQTSILSSKLSKGVKGPWAFDQSMGVLAMQFFAVSQFLVQINDFLYLSTTLLIMACILD